MKSMNVTLVGTAARAHHTPKSEGSSNSGTRWTSLRPGLARQPWVRLALYLCIYGLTVLLTSLLWQRPAALTLAYGLMSVLLLWRWHSKSELAYYGLASLLGPVGEFVAVGFGAWEYSLPFVRIPIWLPLAYGITGLFLSKTAGLFLKARNQKASCHSMEPTRPVECLATTCD